MTQNFDPQFSTVDVTVHKGFSMCFNDNGDIDMEVTAHDGGNSPMAFINIETMKQMIVEAEAWMAKRESSK